jgi:hypothetical protein
MAEVLRFKGCQGMLRIDPHFLYQAGTNIHPLTEISVVSTKGSVRVHLWNAAHWVDALVNRSVFGLKTSWQSGNTLLGTIKRLQDEFVRDDANLNDPISPWDAYSLSTQAQAFETVLGAELQWAQLFIVQPKGAYDLNQLADNGQILFPADLPLKVPEAVQDAKDAGRCIAFDLPTAAAFHLHRLNELVLRNYYDVVSSGKPHPERKNIRAYIDAMKGYQVGDNVIFGALSALNSLHRNPVMHPNIRIDSIEDAISLLGSIQAAVGYMLKAMPPPPLQLTEPPSAVNQPRAIT